MVKSLNIELQVLGLSIAIRKQGSNEASKVTAEVGQVTAEAIKAAVARELRKEQRQGGSLYGD